MEGRIEESRANAFRKGVPREVAGSCLRPFDFAQGDTNFVQWPATGPIR